MKPFLKLYLFVSLAAYFTSSFAQSPQVQFNLFTGIDGINVGKVNCITQDVHGYMWFSDQTQKCITRFDGYHLTSYRNDPNNPNSLGGSYPEVIFTDQTGVIWIGFYGTGLDKFDQKEGKFTHYRHKKDDPGSLPSDTVTAILRDKQGKLWIGSYGGLSLMDEKTGKFKHYSHNEADPKSLSSNQIRSIYEDRQGTLWIGSGMFLDVSRPRDGGLNRFNRSSGNFTRYLHDPKNPGSLINNKVRAIFEDSRGTFWVGTAGDGLHTMDRKTGKFERHTYNPLQPDQLSRPPLSGSVDHITFIQEDSLKKIWIGTMAGGLTHYDPVSRKVNHFGKGKSPIEDISDNTCWWAYTSREGVLWMSTQQNNLYRINPAHITIPHTKTGNATLSFSEEKTGELWMGTDNGLYFLDKHRKVARHSVNDPSDRSSISNNIVNQIYRDRKGQMWLGTENGLNLFNFKTQTFTRYLYNEKNKSSLFSGSVNAILESRRGLFWIGGLGGLAIMDRQTGLFTHYRHDPDEPSQIINDMVTALSEDKSGNLWVARISGSGLNHFNYKTGQIRHYLAGQSVKSIYYDSDQTVWAGTELGMYRKTASMPDFSLFQDPNSDIGSAYITSIIEDNHQNIWACSIFGIYRINARRDHTIHYGRSYGISPGSLYGFKTTNGELLFGDPLGYYALFPDRLLSKNKPLPIIITSFKIADVPVSPNSRTMKLPIEQAQNLRLTFNQNNFSFEFAAIDYRDPSLNQHLYMLQGYDQKWRKAGSDKLAYYFNIPPGKYVFRVKAAGSEGVWAEKSISLSITPPWWKTWWAYSLYVIILIIAFYLFDRLQRNRLLKAERERARMRELVQAKEVEKAYHDLKAAQAQLIHSEKMASLGELTAGIAHEIRNPLNFVNNFSEVGKELLDEMSTEMMKGNHQEAIGMVKDIRQSLEKINHHGSRAEAIVKSMLHHSRNNPGVKELTDINALIDEYLGLTYHGLKAKDKSFHASIQTDFDKRIGRVAIVPQDIGRVLLNLLNNAFYAVAHKKAVIKETEPQDEQVYVPLVKVTSKLITDNKEQSNRILITINDNGMGIPKNFIHKIFQPFFSTKPSGEGTGLGLSLSYDIIKMHGGNLTFNTTEGVGTEFLINIPISTQQPTPDLERQHS